MDIEIVKILSEEIRETKNLVVQVEKKTEEIRSLAMETRTIAIETRAIATEAKRQADAAWELIVITRNEISRPWWKKVLSLN